MKSVVLIILDGWGISPIEEGNTTLTANIPYLLKLLGSYRKTSLSASGESVGLVFGEMGNSEVGHLNLGTGKVVRQDLPRINNAISSGTFYKNEALLGAIEHVKKYKSSLHLLGLVSAGGVHSHIDHLLALLKLIDSKKIKDVCVHMISDGRDTPPKTALEYLNKLSNTTISTISGRYYAMDRDSRWDRIEKAYQILTEGKGEEANTAEEAFKNGYKRGESDEFILPTKISTGKNISDNDALIFFNFRSDRVRQLSNALIAEKFSGFKRNKILKNLFFVSFTSYGQEPTPICKVAFFAELMTDQLADIFEKHKLNQLHIAETEKYPHVTYFFNGGFEKPFPNESRILVPSPKVSTYNYKPEMSAEKVTKEAISKIHDFDFTIVNFANADMVGHTGDFKATIKALEVIDGCLKILVERCLKDRKTIIITADHGNAEEMINPKTGEINTEHSTNPVFFVLVDSENKVSDRQFSKEELIALSSAPPAGILADAAPTILEIMNIEKPPSMTGISLMKNLL